MLKTAIRRICLLLLVASICWPADGAVRKRKVRRHHEPDTMMAPFVSLEMPSGGKMSTSAYPIQITITGRAVRIQSDHDQLLPIYTRSGVLYLTARLSKGTNWLSGLPRGHYFINNRPVNIGQ